MLLAENADDTGMAWPSVKTLADDADLSRRSVVSALNDLRRLGLITRISRGNQHRSNSYQLHWEQVQRATLQVQPPAMSTEQVQPAGRVPKAIPKEQVQSATSASATNDIPPLTIPPIRRTVIEPSLEKDYAEKEIPRWLEILAQDSRWPEVALNGYVADIEKSFGDIDLTIEAQDCYLWLQTDKGQRRKLPKRVWLTWLRNTQRRAREGNQARASPSRSAHAPQVARDPDSAWRRD